MNSSKESNCFALPQMKWDTLGTGVARRVPVRGNYKRQEEEIRVAKEKKKKKGQQQLSIGLWLS